MKKPEHIKIDCPKLRKDKKSSKEKIEKFKKAFAVGGESDVDTFDDDSSDQEVANLCLVSKDEKGNEVHLKTHEITLKAMRSSMKAKRKGKLPSRLPHHS